MITSVLQKWRKENTHQTQVNWQSLIMQSLPLPLHATTAGSATCWVVKNTRGCHSGAPKQQSSADAGHTVEQSSAPASTKGEPSYGTTDSVYIGNLQWWTTDAQIEALCSKYGVPQKIRFFEEKPSGKSKGYVLVTFDSVKAAYTCKQELDGWGVCPCPLHA